MVRIDALFHIARRADWEDAVSVGAYRVSTLGRRLGEEAFIHLSFAHQVNRVADAAYHGVSDLVLLRIDPSQLTAQVIVEPGTGTEERFPHLYGELPVGAVSEIRSYEPDKGGHYPSLD